MYCLDRVLGSRVQDDDGAAHLCDTTTITNKKSNSKSILQTLQSRHIMLQIVERKRGTTAAYQIG